MAKCFNCELAGIFGSLLFVLMVGLDASNVRRDMIRLKQEAELQGVKHERYKTE